MKILKKKKLLNYEFNVVLGGYKLIRQLITSSHLIIRTRWERQGEKATKDLENKTSMVWGTLLLIIYESLNQYLTITY